MLWVEVCVVLFFKTDGKKNFISSSRQPRAISERQSKSIRFIVIEEINNNDDIMS